MPQRSRDFFLTIDLRSLGLYRVFLALLLIHDAGSRWPHLEAFYAASGALPTGAHLPPVGAPFHFSLLDPIASVAGLHLVFMAGIACYLLLLIGWRTRWVHVLSLLFFASVRNRNPLVMHGGDTVLLTFLLWTVFLPLGERFSIDAARAALRRGVPLRNRQPGGETSMLSQPSLAAFGVVFQLGLIYLSTAMAKTGATWRDGTAVYYTLQLDLFATPLGLWLGQAPLPLLKLLTWGVVGFEFAAVPLFLLPVAQPTLRRIALLGLAGFHLGTAFTMAIGSFPFVMITAFVLLLRPEDWALLGRAANRGACMITAYYDDTCGFCHRCCQVLVLCDRAARIQFVGNSDRSRVPARIETSELESSLVAVDETGRKSMRTQALAALAAALPWPYRALRIMAWPGIRTGVDAVYDLVARNRYKFSSWLGFKACGLDRVQDDVVASQSHPGPRRAPARWGRIAVQVAIAFLLVSVTIDSYNLSFAPRLHSAPLRTPMWSRAPVLAFDLVEGWHMFAPDPLRGDGFWVMDGVCQDGAHTDLLTGRAIAWEKPPALATRYGVYWRAYLFNLSQPRYKAYRIWMARYMARRAARAAASPLASFDFTYVQETSQPPGTPRPWTTQRFRLWGYDASRDVIVPGLESTVR